MKCPKCPGWCNGEVWPFDGWVRCGQCGYRENIWKRSPDAENILDVPSSTEEATP